MIHDNINAGNLIFPPISNELPTKGKIKEQSVAGFLTGGGEGERGQRGKGDGGEGGRGRGKGRGGSGRGEGGRGERGWQQGLPILILSCQESCTLVRVVLETWHRVYSYSFNKSKFFFSLMFLRTVEC